jgi:hypothetical protein
MDPLEVSPESGGNAFCGPDSVSICRNCAIHLRTFACVRLCKRLNAALLTGTLSVAILQNALAHRDLQLAILCVIVTTSLIFLRGAQYSVDAKLSVRLPDTKFWKSEWAVWILNNL